MGARHRVKDTYSRAKQVPATGEEKRRRFKERKVVPKFNKLFLRKKGNQENDGSEDIFDTLVVEKKTNDVLEKSVRKLKSKRLRKPLAPSSFLTNSTFGSVGHSSANDTFDRLAAGRNRLPPPTSFSKNAEFLSSSCSSYDNSGILYQSLRSRTHSKLHCSAENEPKFQLMKKGSDNSSKQSGKLGLITENNLDDNEPVESCENVVSDDHVFPVSPQLFSSCDERENKQPAPNERDGRKVKRASKAKGTLRSGPKRESRSQKHLIFKDKSESTDVSDGNSDCLKRCATPEIRSPGCIKKPLTMAGLTGATSFSPTVGEKIVLSKNTSSESLDEHPVKPIATDFAKVFLEPRHALSQDRSVSSGISQRSQGSGKSSVKSDVLTSTPADNSRLRSITTGISPWKLKFDCTSEHAISPVPRNTGSVAEISSPFQSPLSFKFNFAASSDKKYSSSPSHGSQYHTCFMEGTRASDIASSSETRKYGQGSLESKSKPTYKEQSQKFYNSSFELRGGPFKGVAVPSYSPRVGIQKESPEQLSQFCSSECENKEPPIKDHLNIQGSGKKSHKKEVCKSVQECSYQKSAEIKNTLLLHDISKNFSSEKLKEINSFLNRPSFVIPRKPRRMIAKVSENWVEPSPVPRRLTRRAARLSKLKKNNDSQKMFTSSSLGENTHTDFSSVMDPSFVLPRRKMLKDWEMSRANIENVSKCSGVVPSDCFVKLNRLSTATNDEPSVVLPRRISVRLAMKRKTCSKNYIRNNNLSISNLQQSPCEVLGKAHISTHPATKKWQNIGKRSSILQCNLSGFNAGTNFEASKSVMSSGSDTEKGLFTRTKHTTECEESSVLYVEQSMIYNSAKNEELENQVPKEDYNPDDHDAECSVLEATKISCKHVNETDVSVIDTSLGDVFEIPFLPAVPTKRGKGWIRSLSIARASFIGSEGGEQMQDFIRRQTVHRISLSAGARRLSQHHILPLPEITDKIIKEIDESDNEGEDILSQSVLSDARRHVLSLCSQTAPAPMTECFTQSLLSSCRKIGEGVYGEVFMTKPNPDSMDGARVLKIMPIEGDFEVNGEPQKKFEEILSEIIISMELSNLRNSSKRVNQTENFVHLLKCWCVEGCYPPDLLQLWDLHHEEKGSENDRPDIFPDSQLYIVLEFTHGGRDLEGFVFNNARQSLAVFLQIAYSLAVAEQELEFEHRDLHWGNVLVASTKDGSVDFKINEGTYTLQTQGVKATVIDFTLSRLKAPHCIVYNNLAEDPSLFVAQGDYQFEIYREMKKVNRNDWQKFSPYTNVLWLHYILDKMISECYYKNVKTKVHKSNLEHLRELKETILQSESAVAFVLGREHNLNW